MKKILSKIVAVLLVACFAFALTGCGSILGGLGGLGGSGTGTGGGKPTTQIQENVFENTYRDTLYVCDLAEAMEAAVSTNSNPSTPKFENGVRIKIDGEYEASWNSQDGIEQRLTVADYEMKTKKVGGVLQAEGSCIFRRYINGNGYNYIEVANVDIYHDGTYLGLDMYITYEGISYPSENDRSKQVLPVKNVGYFYGTTFIDDLFNVMIPVGTSTIRGGAQDIMRDYGETYFVGQVTRASDYTVYYIRDYNCSPSNFDIAFDNNFNVIAYACDTSFGYCQVQQYFGDINLPSDFNYWTVRQPS